MAAVVVLSNVLVQHPFAVRLGRLDLADLLTWGAFTYPFVFLVGDLTNRNLGPAAARRVVYVGFAAAVICSVVIPPWLFSLGLLEFETTPERLRRIAVASGTAFLTAQLIDVAIFHRLRRKALWRAPLVLTVVGSFADTFLLFTLAFAAALTVFGPGDYFAE